VAQLGFDSFTEKGYSTIEVTMLRVNKEKSEVRKSSVKTCSKRFQNLI
jgi:hypothetical protein